MEVLRLTLFVTSLMILTCSGQDNSPQLSISAEDVFGDLCDPASGRASLLRAENDTGRIPDLYAVFILKCMAENDVRDLFRHLADGDCQIEQIFCTDLLVEVEMSIWSSETLAKVMDMPDVAMVQEVHNVSIADQWGLDRINQRKLPLDNNFASACEFPSTIGQTWHRYTSPDRGRPQKPNIYIVDTGISYRHTEFGGRAQSFYDHFDEGGWDYFGHGTHVAGIAAGKTYGVAPNANLWSVRVLDRYGSGTSTSVQQGLIEILLRAKKPGVVNMSLGSFNNNPVGTSLIEAIQNVHDIPVVVAAGNSAVLAEYMWPARIESAITVGAVDKYDYMAYFSNYGPSINIFAPGVDITSAYSISEDTTSEIRIGSGTSMAAPHVAGAAALIKENLPNLRAQEVAVTLLYNSSKRRVKQSRRTPNKHILFACIPNQHVYYVNQQDSGGYWDYT